MKDKRWDGRAPRRAGALAVMVAVAALTAGCGLVHVHFGSSSPAGSVTFRPNAAFVQCMHSHGLTNFSPSTSGSVTVRLSGNSPVARAYDACKHLLAS